MATTAVTTLYSGTSASPTVKVCPIMSYGDLIQAPDALESTTLDDLMQTFEEGLLKSGQIAFEAKYTEADYDAVLAKCATDTYFALAFGTTASNIGLFSWTGKMSVAVMGGGANEIRKMQILCTPNSAIVKS